MNVLLNHFKPFVLFCVLRVIECVDENLCSACGSLVGTFMEGMERTQRSGFAGGNTDWEQRALGSYMSSEVRYAEITDHLCKSNDKIKLDKDEEHKCHALYEKYEELIEGWYHHKQSHSDLESYLCVENIKACCRKDTCGPNCDPCPDSFNGICSSHGHFEDSKLGNKICHCDKGYKGDWCNDCAKNYFQASKNDTHVLCQRCHKSCSNGCSGPSNRDCAKCKAGWSFTENRGCEDIDECSSDVPTCKGERKICINTEGSFKCECAENFVEDDNGNCVPDVKAAPVRALLFGLNAAQILRYTSYAGLLICFLLISFIRSHFSLWLLFIVCLIFVLFVDFSRFQDVLREFFADFEWHSDEL